MSTGSRAQVFHGNADKTTGGLKKGDLNKMIMVKLFLKKIRSFAKTKNLGEFPSIR